ncbi:hypothetical protein C8R46DRAFT_1071209 [Mycena filopes]|nr:hypothetical protein C8R46DRAFT_1071209 [Mycena filopes]
MSFHVYSEDEESPVLQHFVNETIAREAQTPSPRTELLSPTSPSRGLQGDIDRVRRSQRGPSERYRRQREQAYANVSSRQLLSLLIEKEYESSKLRKALHKAFDRFEAEAVRVLEAERVTEETLNQFRIVNEAKNHAERALGKTNEELRLWKFQFEHAQREIARAQDVVQLVERQRDDAERAAEKARTIARTLNEQRLISDALAEGKRLGYEAGFRRAQHEMAYRGMTPGDTFPDLEGDLADGGIYSTLGQEHDDRNSESFRDINASPAPAGRSPHVIRVPEFPHSPTRADDPQSRPSMPVPSPTMAMPSPRLAAGPSHLLEPDPIRNEPSLAPSPAISRFSIEILSASVFNDAPPSNYPPQHRRAFSQAEYRPPLVYQQQRAPSPSPQPQPPAEYRQQRQPPSQLQSPPDDYPPGRSFSQAAHDLPPAPRRPPSQAPAPRPPSRAVSPLQAPRSERQHQQQFHQPPPDNYIPSVSAEGGIALPPPFLLSPRPPMRDAISPTNDAPPAARGSWYNRETGNNEPAQTQGAQQGQGPAQSWYQTKRPRSNAGSATGRSNAGSVAGRSTRSTGQGQSRHARQASLDSRMSAAAVAKSQRLAAMGGSEYGGPDLSAIREDSQSARSGQGLGYGESSYARPRNMHVRASSESLAVPPPLPAKDARHQKQLIADELRYSDPDLAESWRRDAAAKAETASSKSRPPRNVRVPVNLTFPAPLSPPNADVPLVNNVRVRTMSGSTGKSGRSQPLQAVDLTSRPSLRRVKERRPVSPSDVGSPYFGTINIQPPSQSSSQVPLSSAVPQMDQYLSPNFQTQPLPMPANQNHSGLPSGFVPQSVTVDAKITLPVTLKGKSISAPFPATGGEGEQQQRPPSGMSNYRASAFGGSNTSLNRPRANSGNAPERPLSALSTSGMSRKSGKTATAADYAGQTTLAPGPGPSGHSLSHQGSNTSLRSTNSAYARFDAATYVDPAFFAADTSAVPVPAPAPRSRKASVSSHHSGLSYIG